MVNYIEVKNFKSFKNLKVELNEINVLIGANGVGKSNFVSFFKLLRSITDRALQTYFMDNDIDSVFYNGRKQSDFLYGKVFFDSINSYYFELKPDNEQSAYIKKEAYGYKAKINNDEDEYFYSRDLKESNLKISNTYRNKFIVDHLSNLQIFHFHDTSNTSKLRKDCDIEDNQYLKYDGSNLPAFLYYLKEIQPKNFKRIENTIKSITPFFKEFILEPSKLKKEKISLRWKNNFDNESNLSVHQFSDGTIRFIALTTLLCQLEPPKIIIIDEPELGLHPFAINKLSGLIRSVSSKSQVIISTQSPSLVSNFNPSEILVMEIDKKENQTIINKLESEELENWLEDYSLGDLWEYNKLNFGQP